MYPSQTAVAILIIPYIAGAIGFIYLMHNMVTPEGASRGEFFRPFHDFLCIVGTYLTGFGMLTFRLFRGLETKWVKYAHFVIHTLALIAFLLGTFFGRYRIADTSDELLIDRTDRPPAVIEGDSDSFSDAANDEIRLVTPHVAAGVVAVIGVILEYVLSIFCFTYLYEDQAFRRYVAPFHDIFGLWVFICLAASCLTGLHECKIDSPDTCMQNYQGYIFVGFLSFCISYIVCLNPYFEWELVGKL